MHEHSNESLSKGSKLSLSSIVPTREDQVGINNLRVENKELKDKIEHLTEMNTHFERSLDISLDAIEDLEKENMLLRPYLDRCAVLEDEVTYFSFLYSLTKNNDKDK